MMKFSIAIDMLRNDASVDVREAMVLGSPDEAAEQLEAYAAPGIGEFCYGGNYGLDPARTRRSPEFFVERMMPRFESRRTGGRG